MSSVSDQDLSKFNFPGGFPSSRDLAPSIVFLLAYIATTPILVWRLWKKEYRTLCLIRPTLFLLARYVMLVLRAYMSKHSYGENELIAELVVVSTGTLFLVDPLTELWKRNVTTAVAKDVAPKWVRRVSIILSLGVLAAIGTSVAAASQISGAMDGSSSLSTVLTLRKASAIVTVAVIVCILIAAILTHMSFGLAIRNTLFVVGCSLCLLVISTYRVVQTYSTNPDSAVHKPVVFWICQMVFELIVFVSLISIPIPAWFPSTRTPAEAEQISQAEYGKSEASNGMTMYPVQYHSAGQSRGPAQSQQQSYPQYQPNNNQTYPSR
ncbi:hypothetical protein BD324DRAFT_629087 [Kockovaella imperatae]|uniref:Transmembrane protein n=1 Tax=Kockovaella imperatae TaxID=4999 RepID=A0A1Y1UEK9_9TREE|nr:hypothetical protein BD324DRAFT_629087 [Kockovaella imperatae]ORX36501.1 hypothetical protein BD324DRAFT_629087 [Kockovaella imperatae]